MRVHLIKDKTVREYAQQHASARSSFEAWIQKVNSADWDNPKDMQKTFATADILGKGSSRVVFDIAGNQYRIICKYQFGVTAVHLFVCWIGTHEEYDKLCKQKRQYDVTFD